MSLIICMLFVAACASVSSDTKTKSIALSKLERKKDVIALPYKLNKYGLIYVPIETEKGTKFFLVDTGATRSALFRGQADALIKSGTHYSSAQIIGLASSGRFPLIALNDIKIGKRKFSKTSFAVLPERPEENGSINHAGLIGMDILQGFNMFVNSETNTMYLIPEKYPKPENVSGWTPVHLYNHTNLSDKNLHFFDLRVGGHLIPTVLDTGAEFNIINWDATIIPQLKRLKRRLVQEWEINGAIGDFDPAIKLDVTRMRAGRKRWQKNEFVIMNFDHMDSLGFADKPLAIAGMDIFARKSFYLDLAGDQILFPPDSNFPETTRLNFQ